MRCQASPTLKLVAEHHHLANQEMGFRCVYHKTSACKPFQHTFRLLPNLERVATVNNYVVRIDDDKDIALADNCCHSAFKSAQGHQRAQIIGTGINMRHSALRLQ